MTDLLHFIASLSDPVAERTRWGPAKGGGTRHREHKLVEVSPTRLEFRIALQALLFYGVFLFIGIGFLIVAVYLFAARVEVWWVFLIPSLLCGLIGGIAGYFTSRPRVFDRSAGWYWQGQKPHAVAEFQKRKECTQLQNVHALQLITENVVSSDEGSVTSFNSYELNLVLNDGSRINVVDHGDVDTIRSDAARLGKFLGIPVWDSTLIHSRPHIKQEESAVEQATDVPYGLDKRNIPQALEIETLLPERVGKFERGEPRGTIEDLVYVEYSVGLDEISMEVAICESSASARDGVHTYSLESADVTTIVESSSIGTDPSFHKASFDNPRMEASGSGFGIAWSRGRYYFSASAPTSHMLDEFMRDFPY